MVGHNKGFSDRRAVERLGDGRACGQRTSSIALAGLTTWRTDQTSLLRARPARHDGSVPQSRSIKFRRSQIIWLAVIVAVGVTAGIAAGPWWGVGAAAVVLAISEVIERVHRSRI